MNCRQLNNEERMNISSQFELYNMHLELSEHQREMFNHQKNMLDDKSCLILMDFKNLKISGSAKEKSRDFYNKIELLGFCLIYTENDKIKRIYYNLISENFSYYCFLLKLLHGF